jgi:nicotinamide mononucleotide transporter
MIEIIAAIIGTIYIVLEYKASPWLWLFNLLMALMYVYVYFDYGVYAQMLIQVYYVFFGVYGWLEWKGILKKREKKEKPITSLPSKYYLPITLTTIILSIAFSLILKQYTDSQVWLLDGLSTALSIVAMWLLAKKYYQQWLFWVIVEPLIIIMSLQTKMYATAVLYLIYTIIAIMGYFKWKKQSQE